ncbi:MAG: hypothetical protein A2787_01920 [Omnitrophica WOR_2 bacterium RIFCSPHIGHO2_01_FULL_48_9]|nr:MAG: hypothetical protein A3D10_06755 [Omnitrophica WOR_2 bacterium RIFCSPHIGHO2_02_FULL_48_11]OGX34477.1 MAG: hypothetical protein A2787_01920 [Omnitrophica WOR_2 bacterium RIFCSPHIGHO2_01_FULL_48_9]
MCKIKSCSTYFTKAVKFKENLMKRTGIVLSLVFSMCLVSHPAFAVFLIDTGIADTQFANQTDFIERDLYGRFVLNSSYKVSDIEGYFIRDPEFLFPDIIPAPLRVSLYKGDAFNPPDHPSPNVRHPDLNNLVATQNFSLPGGETVSGYYGITGGNLSLSPGSYWVGLERGEDLPRVWGVGAGVAQAPLEQYHYLYDGSYFFDDPSAKQFALRVQGHAVPEPLTVSLFGSGLLSLFALRRKRPL